MTIFKKILFTANGTQSVPLSYYATSEEWGQISIPASATWASGSLLFEYLANDVWLPITGMEAITASGTWRFQLKHDGVRCTMSGSGTRSIPVYAA